MEIKFEIPTNLVALLSTLTISELDNDAIEADVDSFPDYYQLLDYGLITALANDDETSVYYLTVPGKIAYEQSKSLLKKLD
jgi:hypothetical protein